MANYPNSLFSDFVFLDSQQGTLAIYSIQDGVFFVPAKLETGPSEKNPSVGFYDHSFVTYVAEGEKWSSPTLRMEIGSDVQGALSRYGRGNKFVVPLRKKMRDEVLEKFKRSVFLHYFGGPTFPEVKASLSKLPSPILILHGDYMRGGFDKQYPDFLPPNPEKGTAQELREVYDRAHELGMLIMPYLNPTWWCIEPLSPSFEKYGDVPLARELDGKTTLEDYAGNRGYTLTTGHPVAKEIEKRNTRLFTVDYPSDLIFHDQIGARTVRYDLNPACRPPYAYIQQLIDFAKEHSKVVPLSTEEGFDALINYESHFTGLCYAWGMVIVNGKYKWPHHYEDLFSPQEWELYPLAIFLAHDKVVFAHRGTINDKKWLSKSLAIGYQMTYETNSSRLDNPKVVNWIGWLDAIQKHVCARYMENKLTDFNYLADRVSQSAFEDITIVANLTNKPYRVSPMCVIAPQGFQATTASGDLLAGIFTELNGTKYPDELWIIQEVKLNERNFDDDRRIAMKVWTFSQEPITVSLRRPKNWVSDSAIRVEQLLADGAEPVQHTVSQDNVRFEVTPPPPEAAQVEIPDELKGIPPLSRLRPPRYLGVLDLLPEPPCGTTMGYEEWTAIFTDSSLVTKYGMVVKRIATLEHLFEACNQKAPEYLLIINPYGECFPAEGKGKWRKTLNAIRNYVEGGGMWWETADYSFFYAFHLGRCGGIELPSENPPVVGWQTIEIGGAGLAYLTGDSCKMFRMDSPPSSLEVTAVGREWLGEDLTRSVDGKQAVVRRPPETADFCELTLVKSPQGAYIVGYQLNGWGWLFRVGGNFAKDIVPQLIVRVCEHVYTHPPKVYPKKAWRALTEHIVLCGQ